MKLSSACAMLFGLLFTDFTNVANAQCPDVHIVFARGSGEMPGFGILGQPLVSGIAANLPGMSVSAYAVNYRAAYDQTSAGPGATDMTNHVVSVAQACPNTVFVLGGYSQGASAIVTFGNPLKLSGLTIKNSSPTYGSKAIEFCNLGDPVCAAGFNMMVT
ncbi:Alpha/Beta hydrolase fold [Phytophthora cactorum]|nr:Alpha/Beta hydrolase fold [Phytophthora cactorum]